MAACTNGHISGYRPNGMCIECSREDDRRRYALNREAKLAYHKERNARPEVKAARKIYRETNKARDSQQAKERYRATIADQHKRGAEKYWRYRDARLAAGAVWRDSNRERHRALCRAWIKSNPARSLAAANARRARKINATPKWADQTRIAAIYAEAKRRELAGHELHVDHVIPLVHPLVCGLHVHENLRIVPAVENMRKGNRFEAI